MYSRKMENMNGKFQPLERCMLARPWKEFEHEVGSSKNRHDVSVE